MINIKKLLSNLIGEQAETIESSTAVTDSKVIENFVNNESNTFLVSFPRTGSHWLRMIMELYFTRPSLVRVFYYPESSDYLTLHTHDMDLSIERENVIYLYRDPIETVYSQLNYYKEDIHNKECIVYWADLYGRHLDKWLYTEKFTRKKTLVTYEGMKRNIEEEFRKLTVHFGETLDVIKLAKAVARITKEEVKNKTGHDPQVVQLKSDYADLRKEFTELHGPLVMDTLLAGRDYLSKYL